MTFYKSSGYCLHLQRSDDYSCCVQPLSDNLRRQIRKGPRFFQIEVLQLFGCRPWKTQRWISHLEIFCIRSVGKCLHCPVSATLSSSPISIKRGCSALCNALNCIDGENKDIGNDDRERSKDGPFVHSGKSVTRGALPCESAESSDSDRRRYNRGLLASMSGQPKGCVAV